MAQLVLRFVAAGWVSDQDGDGNLFFRTLTNIIIAYLPLLCHRKTGSSAGVFHRVTAALLCALVVAMDVRPALGNTFRRPPKKKEVNG